MYGELSVVYIATYTLSEEEGKSRTKWEKHGENYQGEGRKGRGRDRDREREREREREEREERSSMWEERKWRDNIIDLLFRDCRQIIN